MCRLANQPLLNAKEEEEGQQQTLNKEIHVYTKTPGASSQLQRSLKSQPPRVSPCLVCLRCANSEVVKDDNPVSARDDLPPSGSTFNSQGTRKVRRQVCERCNLHKPFRGRCVTGGPRVTAAACSSLRTGPGLKHVPINHRHTKTWENKVLLKKYRSLPLRRRLHVHEKKSCLRAEMEDRTSLCTDTTFRAHQPLYNHSSINSTFGPRRWTSAERLIGKAGNLKIHPPSRQHLVPNKGQWIIKSN